MQEVFEKIINKLEEQKEYYKDIRKNTHCRVTETSECDSCRADHYLDARLRCVDDIIEIVTQAAAECKHGHFGCNSNGQHEKCSACCDYACKNRNREWFGVKDDNNGWIPCSGCIDCKHKECDHHGKV